jgi:hypothetical protein
MPVFVYSDGAKSVHKASLVSAAGSADSANKTIQITGLETLTDNLTITADITVEFRNAGQVSIATGKTLTIKGKVIADDYAHIFSGEGSVILEQMKYVTPNHFGAVNNLTVTELSNSAHTAFIKAINCGCKIKVPPGYYYISSSVPITHALEMNLGVSYMNRDGSFASYQLQDRVVLYTDQDIDFFQIRSGNVYITGGYFDATQVTTCTDKAVFKYIPVFSSSDPLYRAFQEGSVTGFYVQGDLHTLKGIDNGISAIYIDWQHADTSQYSFMYRHTFKGYCQLVRYGFYETPKAIGILGTYQNASWVDCDLIVSGCKQGIVTTISNNSWYRIVHQVYYGLDFSEVELPVVEMGATQCHVDAVFSDLVDLDVYTGNGTTTVFPITRSIPAEGLGVSVGGVEKVLTTDYTLSVVDLINYITFTSAPALNEKIVIRFKNSGTAAYGYNNHYSVYDATGQNFYKKNGQLDLTTYRKKPSGMSHQIADTSVTGAQGSIGTARGQTKYNTKITAFHNQLATAHKRLDVSVNYYVKPVDVADFDELLTDSATHGCTVSQEIKEQTAPDYVTPIDSDAVAALLFAPQGGSAAFLWSDITNEDYVEIVISNWTGITSIDSTFKPYEFFGWLTSGRVKRWQILTLDYLGNVLQNQLYDAPNVSPQYLSADLMNPNGNVPLASTVIIRLIGAYTYSGLGVNELAMYSAYSTYSSAMMNSGNQTLYGGLTLADNSDFTATGDVTLAGTAWDGPLLKLGTNTRLWFAASGMPKYKISSSLPTSDSDGMFLGRGTIHSNLVDSTSLTGVTVDTTIPGTSSILADFMGRKGAVKITVWGSRTGSTGTTSIRQSIHTTSIGVIPAANNENDWLFEAYVFNVITVVTPDPYVETVTQKIIYKAYDGATLVDQGSTTAAIDTTALVTLPTRATINGAGDTVTRNGVHIEALNSQLS